ncbi:anticodon nuclease [Hymenobacter amundsenii]|uniref:Anticodon nuclease n=1 Tax=Hymenobacter amundsenii TaxID=2006685 RepID=A0A246FQS4_9BACT|nr:AAA family ATPase [Hymenobacter amundsenii]OWP65070.1 anticodon nuclease [Hymenobacter amundsenii]
MNTPAGVRHYQSLRNVAIRLRDDLSNDEKQILLLYAYNGTGKTRLSMEFKQRGKRANTDKRDTLYFNAFTEDLFSWDNDLQNDAERVLKINSDSNFFAGFSELALEEKIFGFLGRYADFDFKIDYEKWTISFKKGEQDNIKVSRGEENIFIWCIFLAVCELCIDGAESYNWVKYFYIDDPISSLDENNAIAVASDLVQLLKRAKGRIKAVVSSHHTLFFNVMCNELRSIGHKRYFLHKNGELGYTLRGTDDTPHYHHVASLSELKAAMESGDIKTHHFNTLRSILEKTSSFFGFNEFGQCIHGIEDEVLFERALNLLSHGKHSVYQPAAMGDDTKELFIRILTGFLEKYKFELPEILIKRAAAPRAVVPAQVQV